MPCVKCHDGSSEESALRGYGYTTERDGFLSPLSHTLRRSVTNGARTVTHGAHS
jgi:hypothetical protein